jgi:hypothetical protein
LRKGGGQGCQTVCFQTKIPNLGIFGSASDWKMLIYFMFICNIVQTVGDTQWIFSTFCVHLVHFSCFGIMYSDKSGNPGGVGGEEGKLNKRSALSTFNRFHRDIFLGGRKYSHFLSFLEMMLSCLLRRATYTKEIERSLPRAMTRVDRWKQGCQMVRFQTKNPIWGKY